MRISVPGEEEPYQNMPFVFYINHFKPVIFKKLKTQEELLTIPLTT